MIGCKITPNYRSCATSTWSWTEQLDACESGVISTFACSLRCFLIISSMDMLIYKTKPRCKGENSTYTTWESNSLLAFRLSADLSFKRLLVPRGLCMYTSASQKGTRKANSTHVKGFIANQPRASYSEAYNRGRTCHRPDPSDFESSLIVCRTFLLHQAPEAAKVFSFPYLVKETAPGPLPDVKTEDDVTGKKIRGLQPRDKAAMLVVNTGRSQSIKIGTGKNR